MTTATLYCVADSIMDAKRPDTNLGGPSVTTCEVGVEYGGGSKTAGDRSIGNFDVSSLAGMVINAAELHREIGFVLGGGFAAHVGRCTRPGAWTETGVTWNKYDGVSAWTAAGGDIDGALDVGYTEASATGDHVVAGLKALVDDAVANRAGIVAVILRQDTDPGVSSYVQYNSRTGAVNWRLVIDYTVPPVPGRRAASDASERGVAFDSLRGVRPRRGVLPRGGVLPRRPLPALEVVG